MRYSKKRSYEWSENMAYLAGLMASDGCLSKDGRHLDFTSKDIEQLQNFNLALERSIKISEKSSGPNTSAYRVQFSDVALYDFLNESGITPNKSLTIGKVKVPDDFYADFFRGVFDGDGSCFGGWDKRWKSSFAYNLTVSSASYRFLLFLQSKNSQIIGTGNGYIRYANRVYILSYAKSDTIKIHNKIYQRSNSIFLSRKKQKLESFITTDKNANILR